MLQGVPDLAVADSTNTTSRGAVLLGRGDGTFQLQKPVAIPQGEANRRLRYEQVTLIPTAQPDHKLVILLPRQI